MPREENHQQQQERDSRGWIAKHKITIALGHGGSHIILQDSNFAGLTGLTIYFSGHNITILCWSVEWAITGERPSTYSTLFYL